MRKQKVTGFGAPIRPTRHRLYAATGISAFSVAAMLALFGSFVELAGRTATPELEHGNELTVVIDTRDSEPETEPPEEAVTARSVDASVEPLEQPRTVATPRASEQPPDPPPAKDWHAIARAAARTSIDDDFRSDEARAALWRETHSIMFEPAGGFPVLDEEPLLREFRFKSEIHVFGLGVTIGSCFIGLPILGVPVEQRTVAINLFVCAKDPDSSG